MKPHLLLLTPLLVASCAPSTQYAQNYNRDPKIGSLKGISARDVYLEEVPDSILQSRVQSLKQEGYEMVGYSVFNGEYAPSIQARNLAAQEGCERVVIARKKIGQAVGTRMETTSFTPPSVGFVNTDLYTPRGGTYSAMTTVFNPGQSTYAPRDYVYNAYRQGAAFFAKSEKVEARR